MKVRTNINLDEFKNKVRDIDMDEIILEMNCIQKCRKLCMYYIRFRFLFVLMPSYLSFLYKERLFMGFVALFPNYYQLVGWGVASRLGLVVITTVRSCHPVLIVITFELNFDNPSHYYHIEDKD